ncbi:hypothetical protein E6O75_ATG01769 [Venturia nashicola]|uniref:Uncharacterized protein n=1 Tax=Venturia nashicola TaxID=86259 RepID=A0A4Z1NEP9_9PEZI|nr:hypothetical protein E6O75_ATG01769 [Venturia nashicola]
MLLKSTSISGTESSWVNLAFFNGVKTSPDDERLRSEVRGSRTGARSAGKTSSASTKSSPASRNAAVRSPPAAKFIMPDEQSPGKKSISTGSGASSTKWVSGTSEDSWLILAFFVGTSSSLKLERLRFESSSASRNAAGNRPPAAKAIIIDGRPPTRKSKVEVSEVSSTGAHSSSTASVETGETSGLEVEIGLEERRLGRVLLILVVVIAAETKEHVIVSLLVGL